MLRGSPGGAYSSRKDAWDIAAEAPMLRQIENQPQNGISAFIFELCQNGIYIHFRTSLVMYFSASGIIYKSNAIGLSFRISQILYRQLNLSTSNTPTASKNIPIGMQQPPQASA
jgi:hypothetical protein